MDKIAGGRTLDEIHESYTHLTREHILQALAYAAQLVRAEQTPPTTEQV